MKASVWIALAVLLAAMAVVPGRTAWAQDEPAGPEAGEQPGGDDLDQPVPEQPERRGLARLFERFDEGLRRGTERLREGLGRLREGLERGLGERPQAVPTPDGAAESPDEPAAPRADRAPSRTPLADGVKFSPVITHPYYPLSTVRWSEVKSGSERVERKVEDQTRVIGGVECLVLAEIEYKGGTLKEISYNFFAQDEDGNVYYFGEDVDNYKDGKVVDHGGAWKVGENAKEPCIFIPAGLEVGYRFNAENSPPAAWEFNMIEKTDATLKVPAGTFSDVLVIAEQDFRDGPPWKARKYYAKGIGFISENRELNLTQYKVTPAKDAPAEKGF